MTKEDKDNENIPACGCARGVLTEPAPSTTKFKKFDGSGLSESTKKDAQETDAKNSDD